MLDVFLSTAAGSVKAVRAGSDGGPGAFISTEAVVMRGFKALRNLPKCGFKIGFLKREVQVRLLRPNGPRVEGLKAEDMDGTANVENGIDLHV